MKPHLLLLLLLGLSWVSLAQESSFSIKAYLNASYEDGHLAQGARWELARPSFGVRQELKDRWYHELELSQLQFDRTRERLSPASIDAITVSQADIALRYSFGYTMLHQGPWQFGLAIGAQPRFLRLRTAPDEGEPSTLREYQLRVSLIPRLAYDINARWQLEASTVLNVFETYVINEKETGRDRGEGGFPSEAFTFRVGLSYRLGTCK